MWVGGTVKYLKREWNRKEGRGNKNFKMGGIPKFNDPSVEFDLFPPTYSKICKIVKRMKASGSPCHLDQIFIICFKRCSILRSFILEICKEVLRLKSIPKSCQ